MELYVTTAYGDLSERILYTSIFSAQLNLLKIQVYYISLI